MPYRRRNNNFANSLLGAAGSFFDIYQMLSVLQEAERRREQDQSQFEADTARRERELGVAQGQWKAEYDATERQRGYLQQQEALKTSWEGGLRGQPSVMQSAIQPPAAAEFYGGRFVEQPDFGAFGAASPPQPGFAREEPPYGIGANAAPYGIGKPLDVLQSANQSIRDRQAEDAMLNFERMQQELGNRQVKAQQLMEQPGYAGGPIAIDDARLGGPSYGEFAGLSQEDTNRRLRLRDDLTPYQRSRMEKDDRLAMFTLMREQRSQLGAELNAMQQTMNRMRQNPRDFDPMLKDWTNPAARAQFDELDRRYRVAEQRYRGLSQQINQIGTSMFPGVDWGLDDTVGGAQTPPPPRTPARSPASQRMEGQLPDPTPGETAETYLARVRELGFNPTDNPLHADAVRRKIRMFGLTVGGVSPRAPSDSGSYNWREQF